MAGQLQQHFRSWNTFLLDIWYTVAVFFSRVLTSPSILAVFPTSLPKDEKAFTASTALPFSLIVGWLPSVKVLSTADTAEVTRGTLGHAVNKLKWQGSYRSDEIAAELLTGGRQAIIDWLWKLLKEVLKTMQVPQEWRNSILIPLYSPTL